MDVGPEWSPIDSTILFISDQSGHWEIYTIPSTGGTPTQISDDPNNDMYPCWSPDGSKVAFTSERSGNRDIWILDLNLLSIKHSESNNPKSFHLFQNYPNPFNASTQISFSLYQKEKVVIKIYDINGKEVAVPLNQFLNRGDHRLLWHANGLPSGLYFIQLLTIHSQEKIKAILLK
jgi:Tol biopolymer transport system component